MTGCCQHLAMIMSLASLATYTNKLFAVFSFYIELTDSLQSDVLSPRLLGGELGIISLAKCRSLMWYCTLNSVERGYVPIFGSQNLYVIWRGRSSFTRWWGKNRFIKLFKIWNCNGFFPPKKNVSRNEIRRIWWGKKKQSACVYPGNYYNNDAIKWIDLNENTLSWFLPPSHAYDSLVISCVMTSINFDQDCKTNRGKIKSQIWKKEAEVTALWVRMVLLVWMVLWEKLPWNLGEMKMAFALASA